MLKNVEMKAIELENDVELVKKELKRVASVKCRLLKQKFRPDYEAKMTEVLAEEQLLKEVRMYIVGSRKTVTTFEQADVDALTYDETVKALKSIQSKKSLTKWSEDCEKDEDGNFVPGSGREYKEAVRIENMLKEHMKTVKPIEDNTIRKSDLQNVIDTIEATGKISTEKILEMLKELI